MDLTARARGARPDARPTRRCTRPTRTARARPTASSPRSTTTSTSTRSPRWARALQSVDAAPRRRPAPAPPDADQRGGRARRAGRAGRRPPARHRAADARGDRGRARALAARPGLGRADARAGPQRASALIVLSETHESSAPSELLGIDPERCVRVPNGFDPEAFDAAPRRPPALWRGARRRAARLGARRGAGSVRYATPTSRRSRAKTPVLLYVGRFTEVKRLPLLIEAYARARPGFARRAPLVIVGGFPGEWEGEHPLRRRSARTGAQRRLPRRLARPRRAAGVPRRLRRRRAAVGARAVRPGARRGDGVRAAGDRRRRLRPGARSSSTARPAGSCEPDDVDGARQRARARRQLPRRAPPPRRAARPPTPARATPGRRSPSDVAAVYEAARATASGADRRPAPSLQRSAVIAQHRCVTEAAHERVIAANGARTRHAGQDTSLARCYLSALPRRRTAAALGSHR